MTLQTGQLGRTSARERLLAAAEALFYAEGINAVGIDRVIERAGVAKATLYYCFGSKEALIQAYLLRRQTTRQARITEALKAYAAPAERLLGVFDVLGQLFAEPTYRGCAFMKAGAEAAGIKCIREVCDDSRRWTRDLFEGLAREAGARGPEALAVQLLMLYDGASVAAQMDGNPRAASSARAVAAALLEASSPPAAV